MYRRGKPHPKVKFSQDEDCRLRMIIQQLGTEDWNLIAASMPGRNIRQCKERWTNYLSPDVNTNAWTIEEDDLLRKLHGELGSKWVKIATHFVNRSDTNIKNRWMVLTRFDQRIALSLANVPDKTTPQPANTVVQPIFTQETASFFNNRQEPTRLEFPESNGVFDTEPLDFWNERNFALFDEYSFPF